MSQNDKTSIHHLPEEILLRIFQNLLPYEDYSSIRLVSRQWARLWRVVCQWRQDQFYPKFASIDRPISIHWQLCEPPKRFNLTPRFSHSVCYVDSKRSLYIFGGRRDLTTSLNDFWRLDLSTRSWERILATGYYPPPKCSSTFVEDENGHLILFGGRSMVFVDDVHMREQLHGELHSYSFEKNSWSIHPNLDEPGPICDHSASMIEGNQMIVFGGSMINDERAVPEPTNSLWRWTGISTNVWTKISVEGVEPEPRKGHSQFTMENDRILIVGGSSQTRVCRDVWFFSLSTHQWTQVQIENQYPHDFAPSNDDFAHLPFCWLRPARLLVTFGRLKRAPNERERDVYSRFDFSHCEKFRREDSSASVWNSSSDENDETTRRRSFPTPRRMNFPPSERKYHLIEMSNSLQMYRLDLSNLFGPTPSVCWLPSKATSVFGSPSRSSVHYSLVCARSELVLVGGIEKKKLQINRRNVEHSDSSAAYRSQTNEGTLAFATISNIPL